jgi:hypothetical protein
MFSIERAGFSKESVESNSFDYFCYKVKIKQKITCPA